jgi:glycosyltransferase involved in cell wall biosynthesis
LDAWRFKYHLDTGFFHRMSNVATRRVAALDPTQYEVILQIGAWYDLTGRTDKLVVSYHDGNLATFLASPYGYPRLDPAYIGRTLEYERRLYRRLDLIFPMSSWLADSFISDNGVRPDKVIPVGAGVNLPYVRDTTGRTYERPAILFVGRDFERKGGAVLLDAFARVRREIRDAELVIVGPELQVVPEGVRCVGALSKTEPQDVERLLDEYEQASLYAMPSLYEPFGIAFAEAMAHRLPCVGTNICAMPEIIGDGESGFLVPPRDPAALAGRLVSLLKDRGACRQMGANGFARYEASFTWAGVTGRMCEAISARLGH